MNTGQVRMDVVLRTNIKIKAAGGGAPDPPPPRHNRLEKEVSDVLKSEQGEYVQTIPGDTIDLEFASPELSPSEDKRETYLIRASGFYTALRDENRVAAGNWRDKIPEEARARLSNLV